MTEKTDQRLKPGSLEGSAAWVHAAVLSLCVGYSIMVMVHQPPLAAMLGGRLLSTPMRSQLLQSLVLWSLASALLMVAGLSWARLRGGGPTTLGELVGGLWPLSLLPLAWYVFDTAAWSVSPVLLYAASTAICCYSVYRTDWPDRRARWSFPPAFRRHAPWLLLTLAILAYVMYVSLHTIANHRSLGTAAFDLGIHENTLWNTLHGDFFFSSLEGGSHLGVHTSFVMLLMLPIYALAPATETVLILQSLVVGLAALPLYLLANRMLKNSAQALLVALLWLVHPAVGGANFYDFHAIAFAPLFLFTAVYLWWCQRWRGFWITIVLLLSVKEEMAIIVVLLGIVTLMGGSRRRGAVLVAVGAAAYVILQYGVIPRFAGGEHSYAWYYADIIPRGEGPSGLVTTILLNPLFALDYTLTGPRLLFVFQLFAPLAFLSFFTARGTVLISYGLAATLLASRPPLHQIGFQYAFTLLALGFIGALLGLLRLPPEWRGRALAAAVMLAVITCYHYGMIWPRHNFTGGFHTIDFDYTQSDRERFRELQGLIEKIPADASVLASENLVPHVARRYTVETERHLKPRSTIRFDSILVHNDGTAQRLRQTPVLGGLREYEVEHSPHFVLFSRRP